MKKISFFSIVLLTILFLLGCQSSQTNHDHDRSDPIPVVVELTVPEKGKIGETISISALVTHGEEEVEDAEVEFEIWLVNEKENSVMIDVENQENGTYQINYVFDEAGEYIVQVHVTARRMHVMPDKKITIE